MSAHSLFPYSRPSAEDTNLAGLCFSVSNAASMVAGTENEKNASFQRNGGEVTDCLIF